MDKNILQRFLLTLGAVFLSGLFFPTPALAASCQAFSGGSCPVVESVQSNGGTATINWSASGMAQTYSAASYPSAWGLYMVTGWTGTSSGHWFSGGIYTPILTVTQKDLALKADGTATSDWCTDNLYVCSHADMAARFFYKYGFAGTASVGLPNSWEAHRPPCIIFGSLNRDGALHTVFAPMSVMPCEPGFPGTVEPEPDPEWCGMSTSALTFEFGDMAPASVSGQSMSKTAVMACSEAGISYNLYLSNVSTTGRNRIDLGRGVTATVSANNQSLQTYRTSTGVTNSLNITVTLSGTPTSTGAISGTGILAVNYL